MAKRGLNEGDRAERRQRDRELVIQSVERLRSSDGWRRWLATRSHFHNYSLRNQLLIASQRETATRVAGFRAWLALGYCVQKGETAIRIWAPCPPGRKQLERWKDQGADPASKPRTGFRMAAVFAQDQVMPLPPPAVPAPLSPPIAPLAGDSHAHLIEPLADLAGELGYTISFEALGRGDGYCEPRERRIAIREHLSGNGKVATCVHELAHALIRVGRDETDPELSYAQEELVVESIAFSACATAGLETSPNSIPYLAAWSEQASLDVLERTTRLIDRLAQRIESVLVGLCAETSPLEPRAQQAIDAPQAVAVAELDQSLSTGPSAFARQDG